MEELLITLRALRRQFVLWSKPIPWPKLSREQQIAEFWKFPYFDSKVRGSAYHWWTVIYEDGHEELAWLKYKRGMAWRRWLFSYPFRPYGVKDIEVF